MKTGREKEMDREGEETIRRQRDGDVLSEMVWRWHYASDGPGEPGGRSYNALYAPDGRVRIDVSGWWSSVGHTVWVEADEIRPTEEWRAHLKVTGQKPIPMRFCNDCRRQIPKNESCPEGCSERTSYEP